VSAISSWKNRKTILTFVFGVVQGYIYFDQELINAFPILGDRERPLLLASYMGPLAINHPYPIHTGPKGVDGADHLFFFIYAGQVNQELISHRSGRLHFLARVDLKHAATKLEHLVTEDMPLRIVDHLEVVNIKEQDCTCTACIQRLLPRLPRTSLRLRSPVKES